MRDIATLRDRWADLEANELHLSSHLTIHASFRQWLVLQQTFESQLRQTEAVFAPERRAALAQLQARLQRLVEWQTKRG
jgi:hypothetical protein